MLVDSKSDILNLDLTEGLEKPIAYDPAWGIKNTIGGWTQLPERFSKLLISPLSTRGIRQLLYSTGYSLTEIAEEERPPVSREAIRQFIVSVQRPPVITILRDVFPPQGRGLTMDQAVNVLGDFINGSSPREITIALGRRDVSVMKHKQRKLFEAGFPIEIPIQEDILGYNRLAKSVDWEPLETAVRKVHGKGLPSLDLLFPVLVEAGFNTFPKSHGGNTYYYFPVAEEDRLLELKKISPEVFQSRNWQRFNHYSRRNQA